MTDSTESTPDSPAPSERDGAHEPADSGAETPTDEVDPPSVGPRRSTRIVLLAGILAGIGNYLLLPVANPDQLLLASDVYFHAADAFLAGENFYETTPPDRPGYSFLYPPLVIIVFLPHALLGSATAAFGVQTALNVGFAVGLAVVCWRSLERRGVSVARIDRLLLIGFMLLSAHAAINVVNGQVNVWLGFALAVGFDALDREREYVAGIAFAVAALVKVFPAVVGLWLLRQRAWRGVGVAIATGIGGLVLGVLAFGPDLTITYLDDVLLGRLEEETFDGRPAASQTTDGLPRQLAALGIEGMGATVVGAVILGSLLAISYRHVDTDHQRVAAMLATIAVAILLFPLPSLYFPLLAFPLVLLLYLLESGPARTLLVAGTVLTYLRADFPMVSDAILALPLPGGFEGPLLGATESLFVFVLPPTLGLWCLIGACLLVSFATGET